MSHVLWEQIWWAYGDEVRYLRCMQNGDHLHYEVVDPERPDQPEVTFRFYDDAMEWLTDEQFVLDLQEDTSPRKPERRLTPQQKKRLAYARDRHSMSNGRGASRRIQRLFPRLRRRQYRRRVKEFLREQMQTLYRDVNDQSLRSIQYEVAPEFSRSVRLDKAVQEKRRRREEQEQRADEEADRQKQDGNKSRRMGGGQN